MKLVSVFFQCFLGLVWLGCASTQSGGEPIDPRVRAEQEKEMRPADQALLNLKYPEAEKLYLDFQKKFPASVYFQRSQFGLAKSLEGQGRWAEAASLYRRTFETTRNQQPEIAAQALYEISFCYENLGDEARVLASLKDALAMKEYLTPEQALAEIPARMAASYNRMGQTEEAEKYFHEAARGIHQLRSAHTMDHTGDWLAKTFYHMGVFSTNQLSYENLQSHLDTLKMVQIFSLRSAEAGGEPWSKMAATELTVNYRDLWNTIRQIPMNQAMDRGAARREQMDRQVNFTGQLLTLMNELRTYRSPEHREESPEASELFLALGDMERQAHQFLNSLSDRTPLTPEAKKRGGLKR